MKIKIKNILILMSISILITACQPISERLSETVKEEIIEEEDIELEPVNGGSITLPLTTFSTLNPLLTENQYYYEFTKLIYEGLFEFDSDLNVVELLASEYSILENGKVVDIVLKDDIKWHDGVKLTAEDVIFTIEAIKNAGPNSIYGDMLRRGIASYENPNIHNIINATGSGNRLRILFDRGTSNNLEVLTFPIIPRHIFGTIQQALKKEDYKIIGTGPFKFESYTNTEGLKLIANEEFRNGRPYIDRVNGKVLKNQDEILRAFETGQVNIAQSIGIDWEKYGRNSRIKIVEYVSSEYEFLGFNFQREIFDIDKGKNLRKAIMYGINRQSIIDRIYLGHATANDLPIHPNSWLNSSSSDTYGYDKKMAISKLEEAGYVEKDESGFYKKENGERLSLQLLTNTLSPVRNGIALSIKDDLASIGIEIIIVPEATKTESTTKEDVENQWNIIKNKTSRGEFDIVLSGWNLSTIPDISFMFHSGHIGGDFNFIRYSDSITDELIVKSLYSGDSREIKKNVYEELSKELVDKLPYGSLFFRNKALLVDKKVHGDIAPNIYNPYRGIENMFLKNEK